MKLGVDDSAIWLPLAVGAGANTAPIVIHALAVTARVIFVRHQEQAGRVGGISVPFRSRWRRVGPVVLVGHSWGGIVITEAGTHEKVAALVYVAAFAPDAGESINDVGKGGPRRLERGVSAQTLRNSWYLTPEGMAKDFAQDLPAAQTRVMAATQGPIFAKAFADKG